MAELKQGKNDKNSSQTKPRLGGILENREELTKKLKAEITRTNDEEPHFWSAIYNWEMIKELVNAGADIEANEPHGWRTALIVAASEGENEICEFLIGKGANIDARDHKGDTALMWTIENRYTETCALLIGKGADVNAKNDAGWTLLMDAAGANDTVTCNLLLEKGADIWNESLVGCTAISVAKNNNSMDAYYFLWEWSLKGSIGIGAAKGFLAAFRACVGRKNRPKGFLNITIPNYAMGSGIEVRDVMIKRLITMDAKKTIAEAAKKMKEKKVGSVIIVNAKKQAIGVVTERDMVRRAMAVRMDPKQPVSKIMTKSLITVSPDAELENAARLMVRSKVRRLPVIGKKGVLVGIISDDDMARAWPGLIDLAEEKGYLKGET